MYSLKNATLPYLQRLFEDPEHPTLTSSSPTMLEGTFQQFGFSFLLTLLEIGQEEGTMEIWDEKRAVGASLTFEKGEVATARLHSNPFLSKEVVLQFLDQITPGSYHFSFCKTKISLESAGSV